MDRISSLATLADLLQAENLKITLDTQKHGQRDAVLHHAALPNFPTTTPFAHDKRQLADLSACTSAIRTMPMPY